MNLQFLAEEYKNCKCCPLHKGRRQVVMGEGNENALLMLVGEGPGADEDRLGRPFVGRAGKLLDNILDSFNIRRSDIYISNIVKCRPPFNRTPFDEEMFKCIEILRKQFQIIRPKIIVTLGSSATRALVDKSAKISKIRGKLLERKGVFFIPTYHPAFLLRNPLKKKEAFEDFKLISKLYLKVLKTEECRS